MNFGLASAARAFPWLRRAFDLESTIQPAVDVEGIVFPTLDIFGTDDYSRFEFVDIAGTTGNASVVGLQAGPDEVHAILAMHASHDDVTARDIAIGYQLQGVTGTFPVFLAQRDTLSSGQGRKLPVARAFFLPPTGRPYAEVSAIGAGNILTLRYVRIVLKVGQYTKLI